MLFDKVCVVGVGLIGGSFGMAMRERGLARHVAGAVRREETARLALQKGAVDSATTDLLEAARDSDLVFMAPPVGQMASLCAQIASVVRSGAIITDAGSTKAQIVEDCTPVFAPESCFVGGHPMAGSERTGVEASRADLFEGAVWVLTPSAHTPPPFVHRLLKMAEALGAQPLLMDGTEHDRLLATTSHLPHITAAALVHLFAKAKNENELAQQLVASGWRDSTRIAAGSAEMWRDISLANAAALTHSLDEMIAELQRVRQMLASQESVALSDWFERAGRERREQNFLPRGKTDNA